MGKKRIEVKSHEPQINLEEVMQAWAMNAYVKDEDIVLEMTARIPLAQATQEMKEVLGL